LDEKDTSKAKGLSESKSGIKEDKGITNVQVLKHSSNPWTMNAPLGSPTVNINGTVRHSGAINKITIGLS
jgi:hypothetical protein